MKRRRSRRPGWVVLLVPPVAGFAVAALALRSLDATLYRGTFQSGWLLLLVLAGLALAWWRAPRPESPPRRLIRHLWLGGLLVALFAFHVRLRGPVGGGLEVALSLGLVALVASTFVGARLVHGLRPAGAARAGRWAAVHVALVFGLLALGAFHALFVHAHGALAHFVEAATR